MYRHPAEREALPSTCRGLTTVEYAVAGALIVVAVIGTFLLLGDKVGDVLQTIIDAL